MAIRKDHKRDIINLLLQGATPFEKQTFESSFEKRNISLQIYHGKDFIIMESNTFTHSETPAWSHYNSPDWIEFSFMLKGNVYQSQSGLFNDYLLSEGSHHFLFNPDATEENRLIGNGNYNIISIYMPVNKALSLFNAYLPEWEHYSQQLQRYQPFFQEAPQKRLSPHITRILRHLWDAPAQEKLKSLYYESLVNELFCWQWEAMLVKPEKCIGIKLRDADIEKLHHATHLLSNALQEPPSLEWLAKACQLNEYKLKAGFKQIFGTTVSNYAQGIRLEKAQQLIRDTDMTMSEIAYDLGYAHSQHFQRAFKQKFGVTPNSLRG
ncbi:helix-turn-helix transcriptional regulator [Chitinophaga nivalis]|uniref:AraC family transcriptional regulator n=1 Tax=Chitinophaga nivalis TaxID=2991709 RepID=A0ABT3IT77_9BACT|nr:AraC family transcriptional regulator [Chitinophaga nivalis]MCW3463156.1 AraC family transcriptional regulator [Chitinophaga nivalis]MCW3487154.1 AraC family transcriptional regulator [Chitinophaga nivalis]